MDNPHEAKIRAQEQDFSRQFYGRAGNYGEKKSVLNNLVKQRIKYKISLDSEIFYTSDPRCNLDPPLLIACCNDTRLSITKKLLRHGASPNLIRQGSKMTPLCMSLVNGPNLKTIRTLLRAGADPNLISSHNRSTALHICCLEVHRYFNRNNRTDAERKKWLKIIRMLLRYGADPRMPDRHGNTPLFELVSLPKEGMKIVAQLLLFDADITVKNNKGQDIFEYTKVEQYRPVFNTVNYLKDWQAGNIKLKKKKIR
jgi:ankyrin repeat protein